MNYIEGVDPKTGEILKVSVTGNFPYKHPDTNEFIVDNAGQVVIPGRVRERFLRLDASRQEVPDPRPMASAVAFAFDITPEEEVKRLIASADARILANYAKADETDVEFFDDENDDDFAVSDEDGVDNLKSPFEFVRDTVSGKDVPRAFCGTFKGKPEASVEPKAAEPLTTPGKPLKASKKGSKEEPEPEGKDEGGQ